jgi:ABC-type lipopolysaccharide export system ATPase subunit
MTNTQKIQAATRPFIGKTLTSKQIVALTLAAFPDTKLGSILPSDHAGAGKTGNVYADQLFARTNAGYVVLADADIVRKPKTGRTRESLADALASAQALLKTTDATTGNDVDADADATTEDEVSVQ